MDLITRRGQDQLVGAACLAWLVSKTTWRNHDALELEVPEELFHFS